MVYNTAGLLCCSLLLCGFIRAQDPEPSEQAFTPDPSASTVPSDSYVPLTLGQNYLWTVHQILNPGRLFMVAAGAASDHARRDPSAWGEGSEGYATRVGSRLGTIAVRENLAFAVRALDHEDPRYFRSPPAGVLKRARYAASRAFIVKNERGGTMPAYSSFVADLATPFIAQTWRPEPISAGRELRTGAVGIGLNVVGNIGQEFWPDFRKKLLGR